MLAIASLSIISCEAARDCFGYEYKDEISPDELEQQLREAVDQCKSMGPRYQNAINPCIFRDTARLLAWSADKSRPLVGSSVSIDDLLRFTKENLTPSASSCVKEEIDKHNEMCSKFDANQHEALHIYCEEGMKRLRNSCHRLYKDLVKSKPFYEDLMWRSRYLSRWRDSKNLDTFFEIFKTYYRKKDFMSGCCQLLRALNDEYQFYVSEAGPTSMFVDDDDILLLKRCKYLQEKSTDFPAAGSTC